MTCKKATTLQTMIDVAAAWEQLVRESSSRTVYRDVPIVAGISCALGYTPLRRTRFLQLEIPAGLRQSALPIRRTQAVMLQRVALDNGSHALLLLLQEPSLADVFTLFVDDVLRQFGDAQDAAQAVNILHRRFEHWQQLFARLSSDLIGMETQRGLYGELIVLRRLLDQNSGSQEVWDCWRGPYSAIHDFSSNGIALEVKTSVASAPTMHISSEAQLDGLGWNTLMLCLVHLTEIRGGPNTLSALIQELHTRAEHESIILNAFRTKLLRVGVDQRHYDQFTEMGYEVRDLYFHNVTPDFPAIRRSTLNNAIGRVTYELEPSGCSAFLVDSSTALGYFGAR